MADPSNFVNFSDYLGLNDEAGNQMFDRIGGEGARLRDDVYGAIDAQENAGGRDGVAAFEVAGERTRKGLASYGEYMAALRDPARRQELMEKTYGKGSVSALDAALTQAATGTAGKMGAMRADQTEVDRFAKLRGERGLQNAQSTDAYRKADAEYDAVLAEKRAAHKKAMDQRAVDDEDARVDDWVRNSGDGDGYSATGNARDYDPNAMISGGSSMGWDLMKNPLGQAMNAPVKARDAARKGMAGWEAGKNSYAGRKWVKGASAGGGGYDDSAIATERERRWREGK